MSGHSCWKSTQPLDPIILEESDEDGTTRKDLGPCIGVHTYNLSIPEAEAQSSLQVLRQQLAENRDPETSAFRNVLGFLGRDARRELWFSSPSCLEVCV